MEMVNGHKPVRVCACDVLVDGVQQCVKLNDCVRGTDVNVAELTIAFTGTSFDMDRFPDRTAHNGITNGNGWSDLYCLIFFVFSLFIIFFCFYPVW